MLSVVQISIKVLEHTLKLISESKPTSLVMEESRRKRKRISQSLADKSGNEDNGEIHLSWTANAEPIQVYSRQMGMERPSKRT
jgi:hypothetical protein